jgi:nitrogen regulatory protein P-II 1
MKLVIAIIQPQQLPAVKQALRDAEFSDLTCTNIMGTVPNQEEHHRFRGVDHEISLFQKVRIEIAVQDDSLDPLVEALIKGGQASGGAGKIFVSELTDCATVRTGARGPSEL